VLPPSQACVDHTSDQGVRAGNTVDAVHEIEGVHEPGDPRRAGRDEQHEHGRGPRAAADEHDGHHGAPDRLDEQPPARRQPAHILGEPEQSERGHGKGEQRCDGAPDHSRRDKQPGGDRNSASTRRRDGVRRAGTGDVDNGCPTQ